MLFYLSPSISIFSN